jgi:hypothetical protein
MEDEAIDETGDMGYIWSRILAVKGTLGAIR